MKIQRTLIALTATNLVLFFGTVALAHSTKPEATEPVLRGRGLELVDEHGRSRASIRVEQGGEVVFRLTDQKGSIRVKLGAGTDGSGLVLNNDATEPGVHILAQSAGTSLKLRNKDGRERAITPE
jgi:hypothetical protein